MRKCLDSIEPGNLAKLSSYREQGPVGGDQSHNGHDRKTQAPKSDVSQMLTNLKNIIFLEQEILAPQESRRSRSAVYVIQSVRLQIATLMMKLW